ncbi:MAG: hypothetical protein H6909_05215 [Rickettsiaceae bacterium]|nr:hypothetical protein [Rickettsiaceae bacterium]
MKNSDEKKKFTLQKLDYTENMVELMTIMSSLGTQIQQIEKDPKAQIHKNLLETIQNIKDGLKNEPNFNEDKAKEIITKRGSKNIKFDATKDETGFIRRNANEFIKELFGIENVFGRDIQLSKGVVDKSNAIRSTANKLSWGLVSENLDVSNYIKESIKEIHNISIDFADAVHPKERVFYLQKMNNELDKLVKSKFNDIKWEKGFKRYLTEFVESFQKFLTITAPSLFKKELSNDKKSDIIFNAQKQLDLQQEEIYNSLTPEEKGIIQLTHSTRQPNNIASIQDFEKDILEYKNQQIKENNNQQATIVSKAVVQPVKKFAQMAQNIGQIFNSKSDKKATTIQNKTNPKEAAVNKMDQYYDIMIQQEQLQKYLYLLNPLGKDENQKILDQGTITTFYKPYEKDHNMLLHLLDEAQKLTIDTSAKSKLEKDLAPAKPSQEARKLISRLCKKMPDIQHETIILQYQRKHTQKKPTTLAPHRNKTPVTTSKTTLSSNRSYNP